MIYLLSVLIDIMSILFLVSDLIAQYNFIMKFNFNYSGLRVFKRYEKSRRKAEREERQKNPTITIIRTGGDSEHLLCDNIDSESGEEDDRCSVSL